MTGFAKHIVYLDESGTTVRGNPRDSYPVFVLAAVCVAKTDYIATIVPAMQRLKFQHFGHDQIILHERDIRRGTGQFEPFRASRERREAFLEDINGLIASLPLHMIAIIVDKRRLPAEHPLDVYELALDLMLRAVNNHLSLHEDKDSVLNLIAEARGSTEDQALELAFRRTCVGNGIGGPLDAAQGHCTADLIFADKRSNCTGLQLADLIARPLGLGHLRPDQPNAALEIIRKRDPMILTLP